MRAIMGLEVHVQLKTESKLFCSCGTWYEGRAPNENTCPICLGFPGAKPKLNKRALEHALKISLALDSKVLSSFYFSRKSYFYPDMPKNFQISQYEFPVSTGGKLLLDDKLIPISRIHLEEDPARLVHVGGSIISAQYNLIDYNRAGVPLVEIVTEPDITSPKEARQFLEKLALILEHLRVYDPSMVGAIRVDANISLEGGQRVEVKNITGFRSVEDALHYEIVRQESMASLGVEVERETRHYDAESGSTVSLRKKERDEDYGYIMEPDLVRIKVDAGWLGRLKEGMLELPDSIIERFVVEYGVPRFQSRIIVNSGPDLSRFFEECMGIYSQPKVLASWIVTFLLKSLNYESLSLGESNVKPETFVELLKMIDEGVITDRLAKELIKEYVTLGESPRSIVERRGLALMGECELRGAITEVLRDNRKAVADYYSGRVSTLDFLLGQVLRRIGARGDPVAVRGLIKETLDSMNHSASVAQ